MFFLPFLFLTDDLDSFEDLTCKFHPSYRDNNTVDGYEEVCINLLITFINIFNARNFVE